MFGEYFMLKVVVVVGYFNECDVVLEFLIVIKRVGVDLTLTYYVIDVVKWI